MGQNVVLFQKAFSSLTFNGFTFPLPENALITSHPVKLWKPISDSMNWPFQELHKFNIWKQLSSTTEALLIRLVFLIPRFLAHLFTEKKDRACSHKWPFTIYQINTHPVTY